MNNSNNRASLDIYYQDPSNTQYVIQDYNENCGGLCNYDNVGLQRPSYTRIPATTNSNVFNKYIWREVNESAQMYLSVTGPIINGYLKFNDNTVYPIEGNIVKENKKAQIFLKYPKAGIMDQGKLIIIKNGKENYKMKMTLSKYSCMTFKNAECKTSKNSIDSIVENEIEYDRCFLNSKDVEKEPIYLSTKLDSYHMFLGFDNTFIKDTQLFLSYNKPKNANTASLSIKDCKKPKNCDYSIERNIPSIWMISEYNQSCQYLIYSYSSDPSNIPNYYIGCNEEGGVNVSSVGGSEEQIWEFEKNGNEIYIKSVYFGWYLGISSEPSILNNTRIVKMVENPVNWGMINANIIPYSPTFKHSSKLNGYYTYKYTISDEFNIDYLVELKMNKNNGIINIPKINENDKDDKHVSMNVRFKKTNKLIGENSDYSLTIDIIKIKGPHVVLNIKVKKNSNGDIINLSGNPNKLVNNYSLKIPELVPNIIENFTESPAKKEQNKKMLTCPIQFPYAFGGPKWGIGTDCCIGNPGKKDPMNDTEPYDCQTYGCYGRGCGPFIYSIYNNSGYKDQIKNYTKSEYNFRNNSSVGGGGSGSDNIITCPESHKYPYSGGIQKIMSGKTYTYGTFDGVNPNNTNFFCCSTMTNQEESNCFNNDWAACPNPPCEPWKSPADEINIADLQKLISVQQILYVYYDTNYHNWKLYTKDNSIGGINISKKGLSYFIDTQSYIQKVANVGFSLVELNNEKGEKNMNYDAQTITSASKSKSDFDLYLYTNYNPGGIKIKNFYKNNPKRVFPIEVYTTLYLYASNSDELPCPSEEISVKALSNQNCYVNPTNRIKVKVMHGNQPISQTNANKDVIKQLCQSQGACYDDTFTGKNSKGEKIPWCYKPGKMCSTNDDCKGSDGSDNGEECYIDPNCTAWNNMSWFHNKNCNSNTEYLRQKNCNGVYQCNNENDLTSLGLARPPVGPEAVDEKVPDSYSSDSMAYNASLTSSKENVVGKCYNYGLVYSDITGSGIHNFSVNNPPSQICYGTNDGNFHVMNDTTMGRGFCIKKSYIYMLADNYVYRYNTETTIPNIEVPEKLENSENYTFTTITVAKLADKSDIIYGAGLGENSKFIFDYDTKSQKWSKIITISNNWTATKLYYSNSKLYILWDNGNNNTSIYSYDIDNQYKGVLIYEGTSITDFIVNGLEIIFINEEGINKMYGIESAGTKTIERYENFSNRNYSNLTTGLLGVASSNIFFLNKQNKQLLTNMLIPSNQGIKKIIDTMNKNNIVFDNFTFSYDGELIYYVYNNIFCVFKPTIGDGNWVMNPITRIFHNKSTSGPPSNIILQQFSR